MGRQRQRRRNKSAERMYERTNKRAKEKLSEERSIIHKTHISVTHEAYRMSELCTMSALALALCVDWRKLFLSFVSYCICSCTYVLMYALCVCVTVAASMHWYSGKHFAFDTTKSTCQPTTTAATAAHDTNGGDNNVEQEVYFENKVDSHVQTLLSKRQAETNKPTNQLDPTGWNA